MEGDQSGGGEEDSAFSQSDLDMASEEDNMLYDLNVIDGIEFGMDNNIVGQEPSNVSKLKLGVFIPSFGKESEEADIELLAIEPCPTS
ncbi:Hypothetical predicted protein [Olea europaea subsp. europaea]|uniref:Uncharacterized protein n=1 Tax=Olea europaea subsp. europaea TaxID=158383 RepID=A0A8S0S9P6_OLEEU|nr:Hypothetical predicted protein [Olea europaea subsp. europaea]